MAGFSKEPSFRETGLGSLITEFGLALSALHGDCWRPSGTAIIVGTNFALTAKHVIEDYWRTYESVPMREGENAGSHSVMACQILEEGRSGALWNITRIWLSPFTDVAFLRLSPRSKSAAEYKWRIPALDLLPPMPGSRVVGFGYSSPSIDLTESHGGIEVLWKDSPITTVGEVVEVHEKQRDSSMLKFPCFRTNARFDGGMSGGPVFNEKGELCGLICSNLPPSESGQDHISYVTTLWPSMGTLVDMEREDPRTGEYPVLELAQKGFIRARNWEKVFLVTDDGKPTQVGLSKE